MKSPSLPFALLFLLVSVLVGVPKAAEPAASAQPHFAVTGVVRKIAPDRRTALVRHEAIPNYMGAMTMEFKVHDPNELNGIQVGDSVTFRLTVTEDTHWIDTIRKIAPRSKRSSAPTRRTDPNPLVELKPGDPLPDLQLLSETGQMIHFSDFRGKALAFTFFFTRCPLPDFCPRMNHHFEQARELILARNAAPGNWQFLSISFDPEFDKPDVLSSYATAFRKNHPSHWIFATAPKSTLTKLGPQLDLMVRQDPTGGISHNLRTVVLDPQGRIHRQFDGNQWTPQELADAVVEAARKAE